MGDLIPTGERAGKDPAEAKAGEETDRRRVGLCGLLWYLSAVLALGVCVGTGLIAGWGLWYSPSTPYRQQTEALLDGRFALSYSPADIQHDMAWAEESVQHVWGLGVPFWRLPFEAAARLAGQPAFPDRVALMVALILFGYFLLRTFTTTASTRTVADWIGRLRNHPEWVISALLLLLFPPLLSMCRGPFNVYEEVVAYGYLYSVALFAAVVSLHANPRVWLYLAIGLAAGLIGFVRPTLLAYGMASLAIAFVLTRIQRWPWKHSLAAPVLCGVGGLLLFWSNWVRFGSGLEFGHSLNLTGGEIYTTRFGAPFGEEPMWPAARELLGSLFFVKELNGFAVHDPDVVAGQSATIRWRHFYFSAFNVSYLLAVLVCWGILLVQGVRGLRKGLSRMAPTTFAQAPWILAGAWSLMAGLPLAGFYLNVFGMSSRYALDFAPAIGVAMVGALAGVAVQIGQGRRRVLFRGGLVTLVAGWWIWEVATAESYFSQTDVFDQVQAIQATPAPTSPENLEPLPDEYWAGDDIDAYGIGYNGRGWAEDGRVEAVVVLFVRDPEGLVLEVAPAEGDTVEEEDYRRIRAKIGWEELALESVEDGENGKLLTFAPPERLAHRNGLEMVSISFVLTENYAERWHPFRLLRVSWGDDGSIVGSAVWRDLSYQYLAQRRNGAEDEGPTPGVLTDNH